MAHKRTEGKVEEPKSVEDTTKKPASRVIEKAMGELGGPGMALNIAMDRHLRSTLAKDRLKNDPLMRGYLTGDDDVAGIIVRITLLTTKPRKVERWDAFGGSAAKMERMKRRDEKLVRVYARYPGTRLVPEGMIREAILRLEPDSAQKLSTELGVIAENSPYESVRKAAKEKSN